MKKLLITLTFNILTITLFSQNFPTSCPPGTHPVLVNSCDGFRFHRPVLNCEHGFWFCSYGCTGWHIECVDDGVSLQSTTQSAIMIDGQARVWGQIVNKKFEIHFPVALTTTQGYTALDLQVFSVDTDDQFSQMEPFNIQ